MEYGFSRGPDALDIMMARLGQLLASHYTTKQGIIEEYAWHLTSILNTFNAYYCYDANLNFKRLIAPIYVRLSEEDETRRLLAIELDLERKGEEGADPIVFHFDDVKNGIMRVTFSAFYSNEEREYVRNETILYNLQRKNERAIEAMQDTLYGVRYTTGEEDQKRRHLNVIFPFMCDLVHRKNNTYESGNEYFTNVQVNPEYVSPSRLIKDLENDAGCHVPTITNLTVYDRECLEAYLFGSDLTYIEENFNEEHDYVPKTRLAWTLEQNDKLAFLARYPLLHLPGEKSLEWPLHSDVATKRALRLRFRNNQQKLEVLVSSIRQLFKQLRRLVEEYGKTVPLQLGNNDDDEQDEDWFSRALGKQEESELYQWNREALEFEVTRQEELIQLYSETIDDAVERLRALVK